MTQFYIYKNRPSEQSSIAFCEIDQKLKYKKKMNRPLKCSFCARRFKYEDCLTHHIRSDHLPTVVQQLKQTQREITMRQMIFSRMCQNQNIRKTEAQKLRLEKEPVRVSVIIPNYFRSQNDQSGTD